METTAHGEATATGRRRLLRVAGLGGALSALPLAIRPAVATARPTRRAAGADAVVLAPSDSDVELLSVARQLELAAVELYDAASASLAGEPADTAQVIDVFRAHHQAYADSLAGLLGRRSPGAPLDSVLADFSEAFASAETVVQGAIDFEQAAYATHLVLLADLDGIDGATLVASILVVEAQHVTALLAISGESTMPAEPVANTDASLVKG